MKRISTIGFSALWAFLLIALLWAALSPAGIAQADTLDVYASGLNNPRGLTFGADGTLYIAEAGYGGDGADGKCGPGPEGGIICFGYSGGVSMVSPTGTQSVLVGDIASTAVPTTGEGAIGPQDVQFDGNGDLYVTVGLGGNPISVTDPGGPYGADGANLGKVAHVMMNGTWSNVVDIADFEINNDPDGHMDTNPFGLLAVGTDFVLNDSGGNDTLYIDMTGPNISVMAVYPEIMVEFPPGSGNMIPMQAVPTGIAMQPTGEYAVAQLTGFPFPVGFANVFSVTNGAYSVLEGGFTNILDVAYGPDDSLYVLEMATNSLLSGDPTGAVHRVYPNGTRELVTDNLIVPTGMAMGPDGLLYISNCGPCPAGAGTVVRVNPEVPTDVSLSGVTGETGAVNTPFLLALILVLLAPVVVALQRRTVRT